MRRQKQLTTMAKKLKKPHQMTDEDYEAQWDADTLARALVIQGDPDRLKRAIEWAKIQVEAEKDEAKAFEKVAAMKVS